MFVRIQTSVKKFYIYGTISPVFSFLKKFLNLALLTNFKVLLSALSMNLCHLTYKKICWKVSEYSYFLFLLRVLSGSFTAVILWETNFH